METHRERITTAVRALAGLGPDGANIAHGLAARDRLYAAGLVLVFLMAYALLVPYTVGTWPVTGDEPHYLAMVQSLVSDHDLDLANNSPNCAADPHVLLDGSGRARPMHMVGLSLLLAVPYALGGRAGAAMAVAAVTALCVGLTYVLAYQLSGRRASAILAALVLGTLPPFTVYATMIYPELPGACLLLVALVALLTARDRSPAYVVVGLAAAALPWLVIRFAPISVVLAGLAWARAWQSPRRVRLTLGALVPCVLSAALYLGYSRYMYGSWSPLAVYGSPAQADRGFFLLSWLTSTLGWLLDQRCGLFMLAPIYIPALAGLTHLLGRRAVAGWSVALSLLVAMFFGIVLPGFWVQWSPATRYLIVVMPLLAIGVGYVAAESNSHVIRALMLVAVTISIGLGAVVYAQPWLPYNGPFNYSQIWEALPRLASFRPATVLPLAENEKTFKDRRLPLDELAPSVGSGQYLYFPGMEGVQALGGEVVRDDTAVQGYATLAQGERVSLLGQVSYGAAEGTYTVRVRARLAADEALQAGAALRTALLTGQSSAALQTLAVVDVYAAALTNEYREFDLAYVNEQVQPLYVRVESSADAPVLIDTVRVRHVPVFSRGAGLMAGWALVVVILSICVYRSLGTGQEGTRGRRAFRGVCALTCVGGLLVLVVILGQLPWVRGWRLDGETMRRQVGGVRLDLEADNLLALAASQSGLLAHGPYNCTEAGRYEAQFRMRVSDVAEPDEVVAVLEAASDDGAVIVATAEVTAAELAQDGYSSIVLPFALPEQTAFTLRVRTTGAAEVWLDCIDVVRLGDAP